MTDKRITDQQSLKIILLIHDLWRIAAPVGSMHAYWDVIMDMQAFIQGNPTVMNMTADEWIRYATELLDKHKTVNNQ